MCSHSSTHAEPVLSVFAELQRIGGDGPFLLADDERPKGKNEIGYKRGYRVLKHLSTWLKAKGITHDRPAMKSRGE